MYEKVMIFEHQYRGWLYTNMGSSKEINWCWWGCVDLRTLTPLPWIKVDYLPFLQALFDHYRLSAPFMNVIIIYDVGAILRCIWYIDGNNLLRNFYLVFHCDVILRSHVFRILSWMTHGLSCMNLRSTMCSGFSRNKCASNLWSGIL